MLKQQKLKKKNKFSRHVSPKGTTLPMVIKQVEQKELVFIPWRLKYLILPGYLVLSFFLGYQMWVNHSIKLDSNWYPIWLIEHLKLFLPLYVLCIPFILVYIQKKLNKYPKITKFTTLLIGLSIQSVVVVTIRLISRFYAVVENDILLQSMGLIFRKKIQGQEMLDLYQKRCKQYLPKTELPDFLKNPDENLLKIIEGFYEKGIVLGDIKLKQFLKRIEEDILTPTPVKSWFNQLDWSYYLLDSSSPWFPVIWATISIVLFCATGRAYYRYEWPPTEREDFGINISALLAEELVPAAGVEVIQDSLPIIENIITLIKENIGPVETKCDILEQRLNDLINISDKRNIHLETSIEMKNRLIKFERM